MTQIDDLIELHGSSSDIYSESEGAADSYGDATPTWSKVATEKVWVQPAWSVRSMSPQIAESIAGRIDTSTYIGFFKSDTVAVERKFIQVATVKYEIVRFIDISLFGDLSHKEAHLKIMQEG